MGSILRRIQARLVSRPANFSWVDDKIAASAVPSEKHLRWLMENGINAILCLAEEPVNMKEAQALGMRYKHIPMKDHEPPTIEQLMQAVQYMKEMRERGYAILVHCAAGMGRTGTVLAAFFMLEKGMKAYEAIEYVRRLRPGSIEDRQEESLYELEELIKRNKQTS